MGSMKKVKRPTCALLAMVMLLSLFAACAADPESDLVVLEEPAVPMSSSTSAEFEAAYLKDSASEEMKLDISFLADTPATSTLLTPVASGSVIKGNTKAEIDASNTKEGYVMIRYLGSETKKLKVQITGTSGTTYTYNLNTKGSYETFPLTDGNGEYKFGIYQNAYDNKYSTLYSVSLTVTLSNEFAPFLYPNQYVNYTKDTLAVKKATELTASAATDLDSIKAVYNWVITNYSYDKDLASSVQSGYLPDLDSVYNKKKGICFDYAATMSAMLRSLDIPTKLVVGYAGETYHAWITTYTKESGWLDGVIYFDGAKWKLMDPTFASSSNSSSSVMEYIGTGSNYSTKYLY